MRADDMIRFEISCAIKNDKAILPLLVNGSAMPPDRLLPIELKSFIRRQALPLRSHFFDSDARELVGHAVAVLSRWSQTQVFIRTYQNTVTGT
ncbi:MAG: hypothetical protein HC774_03240 [Sphingomonadales bacterium]|nr:hypothetical protein [Sphingomonadales bacterium]